MTWGFSESVIFAAVMTMREISSEKNDKLIKSQKFYQDCYEKIADDSQKAFNIVLEVVKKASRRYIPNDIGVGSTYLALYAFALVIEKQGKVTFEQNKIIKIYFNNMNFSFSKDDFINASKRGTEIGDFRKIVSISHNYVGGFWVNFFRALYKSGTQKDLQDMIDCITSIIMRFSILGNPTSNLSQSICSEFIDSVNYQINQVREISIKEIDWLGIIPISDRLDEMKNLYESLIDNSSITEEISKDELLPLLELLILNSICDMIMLTKQPKSIKLQMINDGVEFFKIKTEITPEQYIKEIANNTELGSFYKTMFSSGPPLGSIWLLILKMGEQANMADEAINITNDILSILLQLENYLDEKYNFLGENSIAKNYMVHIIKQINELCSLGVL